MTGKKFSRTYVALRTALHLVRKMRNLTFGGLLGR
jgi:hypothetical protein